MHGMSKNSVRDELSHHFFFTLNVYIIAPCQVEHNIRWWSNL